MPANAEAELAALVAPYMRRPREAKKLIANVFRAAAEAAKCCQPQVLRRRCVASVRLEMIEKRQDMLGVHVVDAKACHRATCGICDEPEEQAQGIAVREKRVAACTTSALQVIAKERLHEAEERIPVLLHRDAPRSRSAKRRLAVRSSSGVAVR